VRREGGELVKDTRATLRAAWTRGALTAKARQGKAKNKGVQKKPRAERMARATITRYHSGIRGSDWSIPAAG
jgi:hypothetical protein